MTLDETGQARRLRTLKQHGMLDVTLSGMVPVFPVRDPSGPSSVQIGFETRCGAVLRYCLPRADAVRLQEWLSDLLGNQERDQSSSSSGTPNDCGSPADGQSQTPLPAS